MFTRQPTKMRSAVGVTQLVLVVASVASIAVSPTAAISLGNIEEFLLPAECCDYEKALPLLFTTDPKNCASGIFSGGSQQILGVDDSECSVECALGEHGLLNEDKSVKEEELRKLFMEKADAYEQNLMQESLDECFGDYHTEIVITKDEDPCKSGAKELLMCITNDIAMNCPKHFWKTTDKKCQANAKDSQDTTVAADKH